MADIPQLSSQDVRGKLDELLAANREHFVFALHGRGGADRLTLERAPGPVEVIPVACELELRRRLLELPDNACAAFLVPFAGSLPMDLRGRFARNGQVLRVGRDAKLRGLFGAVEVEPALHGHPLVDYLLAFHGGERFHSRGRLTEDALWRAWLGRAYGLGAEHELALDVLLGWAALDTRGPAFVAQLAKRSAGPVRAALVDYLARRLGPAGPLVWTAWERGRGAAAMELAVLCAAAEGVDDAGVRVWLEMASGQVIEQADPVALARLGEVSEAALRQVQGRLGGREGASAVKRLIEGADARVVASVRDKLVGSARLPSAWQARLAALGRALAEGAANPTVEVARRTIALRGALSGHLRFGDDDQRGVVERAEMAVRLLGWLALRPDRELVRAMTPYAEVECLARWYASEGGFVDRARRLARRTDDGPLAAGIAAVLEAVDAAREALDQSFARALPAYLDAQRPASQCLPIDQAIDRIAKRFLDERDDRRLLVLLMDGMAWAQAVEILGGLGQEAAAWGPLAWHAMSKHRVGDAPYPAVLTNFPSLTEVSRSALFAGKPMEVGPSHNTGDDPKRWQSNKTAVALADQREGPKLFLRGESQTKDGSASTEALSLVADLRHRMVAVVLNAIDSSLKGDPSQRIAWTADTIKSLRDLLDKAREVGRTVLLCSDHGHVPADRLAPAGQARKDGARWRVWARADDPVTEFEVGLAASAKAGVWAPRGAHGVVLLTDDGRKYGGGASAGEHGGASLAEAIAPCVLIGCEDHPAISEDPARAVRPLVVPSWWYFDVGGEHVDVGAATVVPERKRPRKPPSDSQLSLPAVAEVAPVVAARARRASKPGAIEPDMSSPFAGSAVLKARTSSAAQLRRVVAAVGFLLERGGVASAGAFAQAMGDFENRVSGAVAKLQEVLNADGYQVLEFERASKQVRLDRGKLAMIFEIEL